MHTTLVLRLRMTAVASVCMVAMLGCGKSAVELSGKLVPPPNTKLVDSDSVQVTFVAEAKGDKSVVVEVKDGSFSTKEIVAGKYKVAVSITPYAGEKGSQERTEYFNDFVNKDFTNTTTPLSYDVSSDAKQSITIDMGKKTVTKN
jgi:hypothetical protein